MKQESFTRTFNGAQDPITTSPAEPTTTPPAEPTTTKTLSEMNVNELRTLARQKGFKGTANLSANKTDLIRFLETGERPEAPTKKASNTQDLAAVIAAALSSVGNSAGKEELDAIAEELSELRATIEQIQQNDPSARIAEIRAAGNIAVDTTGKHEFLPILVSLFQQRLHCFLVGPAGTGKTTLAEQAAEVIGLPFYPMSVGQQTTKSDIFGYMNAMGSAVNTHFRQAYEHGGVFLFDEIDAGNANVLVAINSALANGYCSFPDAIVKRHPDFICCAAGNTFGTGASRIYIGRNPIDGATLDRFVSFEIDYSPTIEKSIARAYSADGTLEKIKRIREATAHNGAQVIASTRGLIKVCLLIRAGLTEEKAFLAAIFRADKELFNKYY